MRYLLLWIIIVTSLPIFSGADEVRDHYRKGLELADAGELKEAIQELQEEVRNGDGTTNVYLALGILSEKVGQDFQALEALLNAQKLNSLLASIPFSLALLYEKLELHYKAIMAWKKFISLSDDKELKRMAKKHIKFLENE